MRVVFFIILALLVSSCGSAPNANKANSSNPATPEKQALTVVERPQKIKDLMAGREEQDTATPTLKIMTPMAGTIIASSTVRVKLELAGDLKGYEPGMDETTHTGNHIHVILDNQPYEAYYNIGQPFELRNVADGEHTLRVFPSRPWHESYKNAGAFQMVRFTVKNGGADNAKPATTADGKKMSNTGPTPEGRDMQQSTAGAVDPKKPLLTYSRPKGEYKGPDADAIMIDFWISNADVAPRVSITDGKLQSPPCPCRVRYSVDGGEVSYFDSWRPIWLTGWTSGKHTIKLELVDEKDNLIDNGGYNSTTREITVTK